MPDGEEARPTHRERRGIEPAVLAFLRDLVEAYDRAHRREHEIQDAATKASIELSAERLEEVAETARTARNELRDRITEHYDTVLAERDNRYSERFTSSQTALEAAATAAKEAITQALQTAKDETAKTEASWVKQADASYVKLEQLQTAIAKVVPREESETNKKEIDRRLAEITTRLTIVEAAKVGRVEQRSEIQMMVPWILAAISLAGLVIAILTRVTIKP